MHIYPSHPDLAKARQLARDTNATAVLYTCDVSPCDQQAQIVKNNLAAIGLRVEVKVFHGERCSPSSPRPASRSTSAGSGWLPDYPDPGAMLDALLEDGSVLPTFDDPTYRARLAAAARLTGAERYLAYARLDATSSATPPRSSPSATSPATDCFSARIGCQISAYGLDLAALCISPSAHHSRAKDAP